MTQGWLRQRERSTTWALRAIIWIALRLGRRAARLLLHPISLYFLAFSIGSRAASGDYLTRVLGRAPRLAERFRHYHTFAATILDRVFLLAGRSADFDIDVHGESMLNELFERNEGCVLLGAHFGSFEILRAVAWRQPKKRLYVVMYEENARKINQALSAINPQIVDDLIPLGKPDTMLQVQEKIASGALVGFLVDRLVGGEKFVLQRFLGTRAPFPTGPFRLAAALRCPMLTMFGVYRGDRRYDVHFELLADPASLDQHDRERWVADCIARYAERLERHCRDAPFNWFNFYAFWDVPQESRG